MILVFQAGDVKVEIFYALTKLADGTLKGVDLFIVEIVIGLKICPQAGNNGIGLIDFRSHFLDL